MSKYLQIEDQTARNLYKTASSELKQILEESFGKDFFKQDICDRIQTLDDILRIVQRKYEEVVPFLNPRTKQQRMLNATALLHCITKAYNEGVVLDWSITTQYKWYPWWEKENRVGWVVDCYFYHCSYAFLGFGLYFVSERVAKDAVSKFKDIYIDYLPE